jgi:hypothetical protein
MPSLVSRIEGRGNGIRTCIVNASEVATALTPALLEETIRRTSEGNPMTRQEVSQLANQLTEERMVSYRAGLQDSLQQYLQSQKQNGVPDLPPGNELPALDAWYNSLPEPTAQQTSVYYRVKSEISRTLQQMGNQ